MDGAATGNMGDILQAVVVAYQTVIVVGLLLIPAVVGVQMATAVDWPTCQTEKSLD